MGYCCRIFTPVQPVYPAASVRDFVSGALNLLAGRARSIGEIARREHLTARHVRRVMRLAFLAPRIVEAIVEGRQPADLSTLAMTQRIELPPLWSAQQQALESR